MNAEPASVTDNCTNKFVGTDTHNAELPVTANQSHEFIALLTRNPTCYLCSAEILLAFRWLFARYHMQP